MPVTFRCFKCNQVLRTGRAKVGAVVACPKCKTELIVPEPAESKGPSADGGSADPDSPGVTQTSPEPGPSTAASEFPDIRLEDIRVEPGIERRQTASAPAPQPPPSTSAEPPPMPFGVKIEPEPLITPKRPAVPRREPEPVVTTPSPGAAPPLEVQTEFPSLKIEPLPIRAEPPSVLPERTTTARPRDVMLPRAAVVLWSLFVILALVLAFVAGLLAGHFLWGVNVVKTHVVLGSIFCFG
ncbi:MAG TPA: hypothetical protein VGZ22_24235 [Isosphaeraceae bacterium]|nr:hypothetical protein [Isosphaeraceae bacterium]